VGTSWQSAAYAKAALAIDAIAAYPVIFATTLAAKLSMSVQAAYVLLEWFVERGLIVNVTRRSTRGLLALKDFTPLRESVWKLRKPLPGHKRGLTARQRHHVAERDDVIENVVFQPLPRWQPDYSELEAAMKAVDTLTYSVSDASERARCSNASSACNWTSLKHR